MWGLGLPKYLCLDAKRPFPGSFKLGGSRERRNIVITTSYIFAQTTMYGVSSPFKQLLDESQNVISPIINAAKELVKNILLIHGWIRHSERRNTLKYFTDQNPYIHSYGTNQAILSRDTLLQSFTTTSKDELYLSIRNVLGKDEVLEGSLAYAKVKNFVNFSEIYDGNYNRFLTVYADVNQLHIGANY